MINKKNISKIFFLVTLIILLIGVVNAAEVSNDTISTDTISTSDTTSNSEIISDTTTNTVDNIDKNVTNKNTEKNLKASIKTYDVTDFNTLHNALTNNTYDKVNINIENDIKLNGTTYVNEAIKTLNIEGNNKTINGNNKYQFLKINSGTVTINNIKIIKCYGQDIDSSGTIFNQGTLTITNSTMENNREYWNGGAIYNKGNLTITNTILNNNKAYSDPVDYGGYGGAIYNSRGTLNIINCTLNNNYAKYGGGAIANYDNMIITNTKINNNTAGDNDTISDGGAIMNEGNLTITNTTLNNNKATFCGGAISNEGNLTITNSTLNNNRANYYGGAIFSIGKEIEGDDDYILIKSNLTITNCTLNNNTAPNGVVLYTSNSDFEINNTIFYKNNPSNFIINKTTNKIELNSSDEYITIGNFTLIVDDDKYKGYGLDDLTKISIAPNTLNVKLILNGTDTKTNNNIYVFKSNTRDVHDYSELITAIEEAKNEKYPKFIINLHTGDYNTTANITWSKSATRNIIINGNRLTIDGNKQYQFINIAVGHNLTLENITITNYTAEYGGAINNNGTLTIINSTLNNNSAEDLDNIGYGGAIYSKGNLTITNSTFNNNFADMGTGGAILNEGNLTITNSTLNNNTAENCGAIYNKGTLTITNSTLNNNHALTGGAIYSKGNLTITNSTLNNNSADYYGGAIYNKGNLTITNSTLNNNSAEDLDNMGYGGAISNEGTLTITNSTLKNNYANTGGAINNNGTLTITNTILNNNKYSGGGGAINANGNITITNSTLNNNTIKNIDDGLPRSYSGGAIRANGNVTITNTTLNYNYATDGGAIHANGNITITNSTLNNNTAKKEREPDANGGAINANGNITITNSTLNNNSADYDGGAIYSQNSNITITNSTLNNNRAANGGAINAYGNITITNTTLNYNYATDGGAIHANGNITITNSTLNNNTADYYGGAIYSLNSNITITNSTLNNNRAITGGAIYTFVNSAVIENNIFITNKANMTGKAIIDYHNATIVNNTNAESSKYGGTICTNGSKIQIKNNIFYDKINVFINSMNVLNGKYVLTTKITDENYTKLNDGRVSYTLDGKWVGSINVVNGSSWISFDTPNVGNHKIVATYLGAKNIQLASDIFTFEKKAKVNALWNAYNVKNGKVIVITNVRYDNGSNVNSGRVSYSVNGKWIGSIDVKNGSSWINFNYTSTNITFKATFITKNNSTQNIYTRTLNLTELKTLVTQTETASTNQTLKNSSVHLMINSMNLLNGKYVLTSKVTDKNYAKLNVGRVSYTLDGKWVGSVNVTNGSSWISFAVPGVGNHTIVATYVDANGKSITTDTYTFEKRSSTNGVNALFNAYNVKNGKVIIITNVKYDNGNNINSGRISYSVNGKWIGSIDVKNGTSWINFNYTSTNITFQATFITKNNVTQNIYTRTLDLDEIAKLRKV